MLPSKSKVFGLFRAHTMMSGSILPGALEASHQRRILGNDIATSKIQDISNGMKSQFNVKKDDSVHIHTYIYITVLVCLTNAIDNASQGHLYC